ncbi:hypothetical protein KXV68_006359, partial [Aspergillus fumigatus]
ANTIPEAELPPRAAFVAPSQLYKTAGASPHGPSVLRLLLPSQLPFSRGSRGPPAPLIPVTSGNDQSIPPAEAESRVWANPSGSHETITGGQPAVSMHSPHADPSWGN